MVIGLVFSSLFPTWPLQKIYDNHKLRFAKNYMIIIKYSPTRYCIFFCLTNIY